MADLSIDLPITGFAVIDSLHPDTQYSTAVDGYAPAIYKKSEENQRRIILSFDGSLETYQNDFRRIGDNGGLSIEIEYAGTKIYSEQSNNNNATFSAYTFRNSNGVSIDTITWNNKPSSGEGVNASSYISIIAGSRILDSTRNRNFTIQFVQSTIDDIRSGLIMVMFDGDTGTECYIDPENIKITLNINFDGTSHAKLVPLTDMPGLINPYKPFSVSYGLGNQYDNEGCLGKWHFVLYGDQQPYRAKMQYWYSGTADPDVHSIDAVISQDGGIATFSFAANTFDAHESGLRYRILANANDPQNGHRSLAYGSSDGESSALYRSGTTSYIHTPANETITGTPNGTVTFEWENTTNSEITGAVLECKLSGGSDDFQIFKEVTGSTTSTDVAMSSLPVGDVQWRVRALTTDGIPGQWSAAQAFTFMMPPEITQQPQNADVKEDTELSFTVSAVNGALSYQWFKKDAGEAAWSSLTGASGNSLHLVALREMNGRQLKCVVTNSVGSEESDIVTLTVRFKPDITTQPQDAHVLADSTVSFSVEANGNGYPLQYQWKKTTDGNVWEEITDANTDTYTLTAQMTDDMTQFMCVVSNENGDRSSDIVVIDIIKPPVITGKSNDFVAYAEDTCSIYVTASGWNNTYQWQKRPEGSSVWVDVAVGGNDSTYTFTNRAVRTQDLYRCYVSNLAGSVYSEYISVSVIAEPIIIRQPGNASTIDGEQLTFTVSADGKNLLYQWRRRSGDDQAWSDVVNGGDQETLYVPAIASENGYQYQCIISNLYGEAASDIVSSYIATRRFDLVNGMVLPEGEYVFSLNAVPDSMFYRLGFEFAGQIVWIAVDRDSPLRFQAKGKRPLYIQLYGKRNTDLDGCTIQPMLEAGNLTHAWVSPSRAYTHNIADSFNYEWFCIENRKEDRSNIITASMPCDVTIRYRPIWKDTI